MVLGEGGGGYGDQQGKIPTKKRKGKTGIKNLNVSDQGILGKPDPGKNLADSQH